MFSRQKEHLESQSNSSKSKKQLFLLKEILLFLNYQFHFSKCAKHSTWVTVGEIGAFPFQISKFKKGYLAGGKKKCSVLIISGGLGRKNQGMIQRNLVECVKWLYKSLTECRTDQTQPDFAIKKYKLLKSLEVFSNRNSFLLNYLFQLPGVGTS